MKPCIICQQVSKKYSRNANRHLNYGIKDLFNEIFGRQSDLTLREDEFLAVDNISFHLEQGESMGIIGRNGSGKTTLLKMLNGLIKPDRGTIVIDGRVQALINLGAGFNASLSGRDNIYNSASLMGMRHKEIRSIVGEVIEFSELEEFIDSPVETYSSGMKARLGFAVAINLQPDILLIDEILAVGDFAFQNKCFIRMHELRKQGVSIVLVSHSHTHVIQICERAIWLDHGKVEKKGPAKETVQAYLDFLDEREKERIEHLKKLKTDNASQIEQAIKKKPKEGLYGPIYAETDRLDEVSVQFYVEGERCNAIKVHDQVDIEYSFRLKQYVTDLNVTLAIFRKEGLKMSAISTLNGDLLKDVHEGEVRCRVRIPDFNLNPGQYVLVMPVHEGKSYLYRDIVKEFVVLGDGTLNWEYVDLRCEYFVDSHAVSRSSDA